MDRKRLADDLRDGLPRIERRIGVLEDHLHLASQRTEPTVGQVRDVLALEPDRSGCRIEETQHQAGCRRLAAAGLADDPERLASADRQRDVFDRVNPSVLRANTPCRTGKCFVTWSSATTASSPGALIGRPSAAPRDEPTRSCAFLRLGGNSGRGGRPATSASSGSSIGQGANWWAHRGWNGHPLGTLRREGGEPSIGTSFSRRRSMVGIDDNKPQV